MLFNANFPTVIRSMARVSMTTTSADVYVPFETVAIITIDTNSTLQYSTYSTTAGPWEIRYAYTILEELSQPSQAVAQSCANLTFPPF